MAIYNGTQKIDMSGVAKVYVGTQLVYQKAPQKTWVTLFTGTKTFSAGASTSTNWDIGIHQTDIYKFRITCSFKVRSYASGSAKHGQISQYNPSDTLYTGYPMNTYTLASAIYETDDIEPTTSATTFNIFGVYSKDKSGVILPTESCLAKIVLAFKNLTNGPVFGPSYTEAAAQYNEASITITKVEQYV